MDFKIIGLAHGPLLGVQYIDKESEDDWIEFNIYLLLICLSWRFW